MIALFTRRIAAPLAALALLALSGCVAYPDPYYGGYGYAPAPVYAAPTVVVGGGWWGGCCWGGRHWR